ncbi:hypothetical protein IAU60_000655 [Kwoniella sp. DSM 27419]
MTYLTQYLPFPSAEASSSTSALPPPGSHLVISDTLASPGYFAVYHLVSAALGKEKRKIVWVDLRAEGRASWEAVLKKLGAPLPPSTSSTFVHISPTSLPASIGVKDTNRPRLFDEHDVPSLRATYDAIVASITGGAVVILDGLSELTWAGVPAEEVARMVRALLAHARKNKAVLVSTLHSDHLPLIDTTSSQSEGSTDSELLERLLRLGQGVWWRIAHLPSGRSGDVMGEISSHPLGDTSFGKYPSVPRSNPLQYRLEASTVRVFPKGTGRGFL